MHQQELSYCPLFRGFWHTSLPGGMVCSVADKTIVETCLREMKEEIGGLNFDYHSDDGGSGISVLGVLRCNW